MHTTRGPAHITFRPPQVANDAANAARQAARSPWLERAARLGYAGRGLLYLIVGGLAAMAAFGLGGEITGHQGALATIAAKPFGGVIMALMAVGFIGQSLWHVVRAVFDPERHGTSAKGVAIRIGYGIVAALYGSLTVLTLRLLSGDGSGGDRKQALSARLLEQPAGPWLVGFVGLAVIALGLGQMYWAYKLHFAKELDLSGATETVRRWVYNLGRAGYLARGVVFGIIGLFLLSAARNHDPGEVRGLDGALMELAQQSWGPWLLGATALGLVAFGAFSLASARYRRIRL